MKRRRSAAVVVGLVGALSLSACFAVPPVDTSFETRIPEALEASAYGYTEAYAEKAIDGFSTVLAVGMQTDSTEVPTSQLEETIAIIVDGNTLGGDQLRLTIRTADEFLSLDDQAIELGADPIAESGTTLTIHMDEARAIAAAAAAAASATAG
ncbi:hypothetical protein ACEXQD_05115 [Herbiconiux sp. P15]|uniref:hypothetical protein n=1 Tax=Herbiconiux liukaitaii TaxID=3342799 RepID=UPI0035B77FF8